MALVAAFALGLALNPLLQPQSAAPTAIALSTRWQTVTPVATIPLQYRPATSPEAQPQLILEIVVTDAASGEPVPARIWVAGTVAAESKARQNITLRLSNTEEKLIRLMVEAEGYQVWERELRFRILHSRREELKVELERLVKPAGSGA